MSLLLTCPPRRRSSAAFAGLPCPLVRSHARSLVLLAGARQPRSRGCRVPWFARTLAHVLSLLVSGLLIGRGCRGSAIPAHHDDRVHASRSSAPDLSTDRGFSPEVADAWRGGGPVAPLETPLPGRGPPRPDNRAAADDIESAVRAGGAVPATIAVLDGVPHVGLTACE